MGAVCPKVTMLMSMTLWTATVSVTAVLLLSAAISSSAQQATTVSAASVISVAQLQETQAPMASNDDKRTAKQKVLEAQARRLVTMANELKTAVDKTNKNILSLDVVHKAEDIEALAREMKGQVRR
jgi:uncharacterized protein YjaG (DUF416 family)